MLEPQLEKPVATDSVALTDNNFVCALSSFRRRQAIQLPICRAWWTSFIQPSTVSPCLPVPQVFLCPRCLFPFVSYGKYFHAKFHGFLFGNGTRNLIASSWRNKTLRKRWKLFERKIQCILAFYSISYYIYFLLLNTLTQSANHFPNSWYTLILPKATRT